MAMYCMLVIISVWNQSLQYYQWFPDILISSAQSGREKRGGGPKRNLNQPFKNCAARLLVSSVFRFLKRMWQFDDSVCQLLVNWEGLWLPFVRFRHSESACEYRLSVSSTVSPLVNTVCPFPILRYRLRVPFVRFRYRSTLVSTVCPFPVQKYACEYRLSVSGTVRLPCGSSSCPSVRSQSLPTCTATLFRTRHQLFSISVSKETASRDFTRSRFGDYRCFPVVAMHLALIYG